MIGLRNGLPAVTEKAGRVAKRQAGSGTLAATPQMKE